MPMADIVFLAFIAIAVAVVVVMSVRSKRQQLGAAADVNPDDNVDAVPQTELPTPMP